MGRRDSRRPFRVRPPCEPRKRAVRLPLLHGPSPCALPVRPDGRQPSDLAFDPAVNDRCHTSPRPTRQLRPLRGNGATPDNGWGASGAGRHGRACEAPRATFYALAWWAERDRPCSPVPRRPSEPRLRVSFGAAIRARRLKAGLTQEALAEAAGLTPVHLGRLERGAAGPSLEAVWALSAALECRPRDLISEME